MKYKKVVLTVNTLGLIKDRLNKLMTSGICKRENAWGDINPTKRNVDYSHCANQVYLPQPVFIRKLFISKELAIFIDSNHSGFLDTVFETGDVFYLANS